MTATGDRGRISRKERTARAAAGMTVGHPELLTCKPGRTEWKHLAKWLAEMWPRDEYTAIAAEVWRQDPPPGTQDRR